MPAQARLRCQPVRGWGLRATTSADGILANPGALSGLDFQVRLKGASMADLYEVTGLVLPNTPPFETNGRLTGSLEPERAVWQYTDFRG